jgi:hypothetical protein
VYAHDLPCSFAPNDRDVVTTTLNVYGHLFESLQQRLAERLDEAFCAARAPYLPSEPVENVVPLRHGLKKVASEQRVSE